MMKLTCRYHSGPRTGLPAGPVIPEVDTPVPRSGRKRMRGELSFKVYFVLLLYGLSLLCSLRWSNRLLGGIHVQYVNA